MTSLLELAMWNARMDDSLDHGKTMGGGNKKMKMDESEFRLQCRISCGADAVIVNVLPYLLPPYFELPTSTRTAAMMMMMKKKKKMMMMMMMLRVKMMKKWTLTIMMAMMVFVVLCLVLEN